MHRGLSPYPQTVSRTISPYTPTPQHVPLHCAPGAHYHCVVMAGEGANASMVRSAPCRSGRLHTHAARTWLASAPTGPLFGFARQHVALCPPQRRVSTGYAEQAHIGVRHFLYPFEKAHTWTQPPPPPLSLACIRTSRLPAPMFPRCNRPPSMPAPVGPSCCTPNP